MRVPIVVFLFHWALPAPAKNVGCSDRMQKIQRLYNTSAIVHKYLDYL